METYRNYINGEWVGGDTFENRNPANTEEVVGLFVKGTAEDAERAAAAPKRRWPAGRECPLRRAASYLFKVADILESRLDQLAEDMTREEGKTLPEAKGETMRSINIFRYYGSEGSRLPGFQVPSERPRVHMFAIRKPSRRGRPDFAVELPERHPGLEDGAGAHLRQHGRHEAGVGGAALLVAHHRGMCHEAGIPKGVVNYIAGPGSAVGSTLVNAKPVKAVSFTGSCQVGEKIHEQASKRRLKIQLEMGGKNPTIVLADCNLEETVANVVNAAFFSTGTEVHRHRPLHRRGAHLREVRRGPGRGDREAQGRQRPRGGASRLGPAIDQAQLDTDLRYIEIGKREAGRARGRRQAPHRPRPTTKGYFVEPTGIPRCHPGDDHRPGRDLRSRSGRV